MPKIDRIPESEKLKKKKVRRLWGSRGHTELGAETNDERKSAKERPEPQRKPCTQPKDDYSP